MVEDPTCGRTGREVWPGWDAHTMARILNCSLGRVDHSADLLNGISMFVQNCH